MSHASALRDSYMSDYDPSEHSPSDTQQQVERERDHSQKRGLCNHEDLHAIIEDLRHQTPMLLSHDLKDLELLSCHGEQGILGSLNIQLQGLHDLSTSIKSLLSAIEWANNDRVEIRASSRRAGMWALLVGSLAMGLIAQTINTTLPELISQVAASLNAGRTNVGGSTSNAGNGYSYKTFMSSRPKEFFSMKGSIWLLAWFENIESKLKIMKCADGSKVEFAACMLQGSTLT
ncbi:hypothetical protein Tco_0825477 [Tanacetum coccineum]